MNLLATASDLQVKGLSQIQETRSQSGQPPTPEVKTTRQPPTPEVKTTRQPPPVPEVKVKPAPPAHELRPVNNRQLTQHSVPEGQKFRVDQGSQNQSSSSSSSLLSTTGSLKRKHEQPPAYSPLNSPGGYGSSQQPDSEERLAAAVSDLKTEAADHGGGGGGSGCRVLAPLHTETEATNQVNVEQYFNHIVSQPGSHAGRYRHRTY